MLYTVAYIAGNDPLIPRVKTTGFETYTHKYQPQTHFMFEDWEGTCCNMHAPALVTNNA